MLPSGLRVLPFGDAGLAVDGDDVAERRLDVDHAIDDDRRALVGAGGHAAFDAVDPHRTEPPDAVLVDLAQRRVVLVAEVAADLGEVVIARRAAIREISGVTAAMTIIAVVAIRIVMREAGRARHDRMANSSARTNLVFIDLSISSEIHDCVEMHTARHARRWRGARQQGGKESYEQFIEALDQTWTSSYISMGVIDIHTYWFVHSVQLALPGARDRHASVRPPRRRAAR